MLKFFREGREGSSVQGEWGKCLPGEKKKVNANALSLDIIPLVRNLGKNLIAPTNQYVFDSKKKEILDKLNHLYHSKILMIKLIC